MTHRHESVSLRHSVSDLLRTKLGDEAIDDIENTGVYSVYQDMWNSIEPPLEEQKDVKFQQAQNYLDKYAQAELVITNRLHVTLPCIAFDTPVILVHDNPNDPRFGGLKQYINLYSTDDFADKVNLNPITNITNPGNISNIADKLNKRVENFISKDTQQY